MGTDRTIGIKVALLVAALLLIGAASAVASPTARLATTYTQKTIITSGKLIPAKPDWHFDLVLVDSAKGLLYVADPSNKQVDIIDIATDKYVAGIGGFTGTLDIAHGFDQLGPAGLALDDKGQLWAGDGKGMVKVISAAKRKVIATIHTGAKKHADVFAFDPADGVMMVTCPAEKTPFVAYFNATTHKMIGKTAFAGATDMGFPAYSNTTHRFYLGISTKKGGKLDVIDPKTRKVQKSFALGKCTPSGAAFGPGTQLMVGCAHGAPVIMDVATGKVLAKFKSSDASSMGIDQVVYDSSAKRYLLADAPNIRVIDAATMKTLPAIMNGDLGGHAVGVDTANNEVFTPNADKGILVFAP